MSHDFVPSCGNRTAFIFVNISDGAGPNAYILGHSDDPAFEKYEAWAAGR